MSVTVDRRDPRLAETDEATGMQKAYLVLSPEERAKGFVRPVRAAYKHTGERPKYPTRDLTPEELARYADVKYVQYEGYPPEAEILGRFWTAEQLRSGCGAGTKMGRDLSESYAREPKFYGATFCAGCRTHLPVAEFRWEPDGEVVGS
jgi:hypothetical protein